MKYGAILFLLGRLSLALSVALLLPAGLALYLADPVARVFFYVAALVCLGGLSLQRVFRSDVTRSFGTREAFLLVSATWLMATFVGALPYVFVKGPEFFVDALFESASGFTTTGASVLTDVESESPALLLWRSLTQWLGGMGIIVLGLAILPKLAIGGMELMRAEAPGPVNEKLTPRIARTAKALWGIYAGMTVLLFALLRILGMETLDALNHAMATLATGGFSTRNGSIGAYSGPIQWVIVAFMLLAGVNFALHFNLLRNRSLKSVFNDPEFRVYSAIVFAVTLLVTGNLLSGEGRGFVEALRLGAFQSASVITTTGFVTADFDAWPEFSRALLFLLMFVGGCGGSTSGSIKVVRFVILFKKLACQVRSATCPHAVVPVRLGLHAIRDDVVQRVAGFLVLFIVIFVVGGLLLILAGLDPLSALTASATCLGNVGPGLGDVGPTHSMAQLPAMAKLILISLMLVGRLELYTMLVAVAFVAQELKNLPPRRSPGSTFVV